jgi:predicted N-acetyltransferase YhbS
MTPNLSIRPELPEDFPAVHALVRDAFGREIEAELVCKLRDSDGYLPALSLVAVDGDVVGHIMITTLDIVSDSGEAVPTTILAPLAVAPDRQLQGIGGALMLAAIDRARSAGHRSMILVGHPTYYPRFGCRSASSWGIHLSFPIPDDVFMALELEPGALAHAAGTVTLPSAFDET